jgi:endonuclease/exonuclease/phosphatase family metal-dependent hydrolase
MKKRKPTFFNKIYLFTGIGLVFCLIMGILAGKVDPRSFWPIAFFGLAYPFFLLLNFLLVILLFARKKWFFALLVLAIIFTGWHSLIATVSLTGDSGEGPKKDPALVRMMTYNVHAFKPYGETSNEAVKSQILEVIRKENPDIICFQEYYSRRKGTYDITDSLQRMLKTRDFYFYPSDENAYEAYGLAIFSRYPIVNKGSILFGKHRTGNESLYVDVLIHKKTVRIYNVHLQSISFDQQDYNYLDKVKYKMDAEVESTKRILRMLRYAFLKRAKQVDIMKAHMQTCEIPFLVAGDFNDTPASYAVTQMTKSLDNTFIEKGTGLGQTYNGKFPNFQIDYISATKGITVINHRIIQAKLSDHFPVRSDLRID